MAKGITISDEVVMNKIYQIRDTQGNVRQGSR